MNAILFFDLFATTFLLFLGLGGFKRGFVVEIGKIIALIFTLWLSINYYVDFAQILQQEFTANPYFILFVSFSLIFIITLIVTRIIAVLIDQIIGFKKNRLLNQVLGFVIGVMKGSIPIALILWAFELLPVQQWTDTLYRESRIANIVKTIRDKNVEYFGWEDPVNAGKEYVKSLIIDDSPAQGDDP
ncbi:MAG: CvpA family protein [Candidatus Neomarinimicrobiota bacterium]